MAKVRKHRFKARNPPNILKVGVAKHKVGGANLDVGNSARASDPKSLKLAVYSKDIGVCNLYISDFLYR